MMRVPHTYDTSEKPLPQRLANEEFLNADLAPKARRTPAMHGLLVAGAMSTPLWIALYFLLR